MAMFAQCIDCGAELTRSLVGVSLAQRRCDGCIGPVRLLRNAARRAQRHAAHAVYPTSIAGPVYTYSGNTPRDAPIPPLPPTQYIRAVIVPGTLSPVENRQLYRLMAPAWWPGWRLIDRRGPNGLPPRTVLLLTDGGVCLCPEWPEELGLTVTGLPRERA